MDQTLVQVVLGYAMTFVLEYLKKASWFPGLSETSLRWVKIAWAWLIAAGSALAVSFTFDPTLGQLTVNGLTWRNVSGGLTAFILSLLVQKLTYRVAVKPAAGGGV